MAKAYNYNDVNTLEDLQNKKRELKMQAVLKEESIKNGVGDYIHQFTPGAIFKKYTAKPKEKVVSLFGKVKSWFSKKKS